MSLTSGSTRTSPSASTSGGADRWTLPEQGPTDPDHGRTSSHGGFEVVAHAHGALRQAQLVGQPPDPPKAARAAAGPGAATVMSPRTSSPRSTRRPTSSPTSAGGTRCGRAGPSCRPAPGPGRPGAKRAIRAPSASRATLCHRPTSGASARPCFAARRRGSARRLRRRPRVPSRRVLPHSSRPGHRARPPAPRAPHRARNPWSRRPPALGRGRLRPARSAAGPRAASARPRR